MAMRKIKSMTKTVIGKKNGVRIMRTVDSMNGLIGTALIPLMPERVEHIKQDEFTLVNEGERRNLIDTWLRAGLARQAFVKGDLDEVAEYHRKFWEGKGGKEYHDQNRAAFHNTFIPNFSFVIDDLNERLADQPEFKTLVEIGSGSGQMLDHLGQTVPTIDEFIGIDLSPDTIRDCQAEFTNPKLTWVAADGDVWVRENGQPHMVFVSHRGVLEYFPQKNLESLFRFIATELSPTIFIAIEPVGIDHDLDKELDSTTYGREFSFSHNYPHLFAKTGFDVHHVSFKEFYTHKLVAVIATAGL